MAKWIMSRPEKHANPGELQVARWLKSLPDDWLVRWGYYYKDKNLHREGDFLVLGPHGGLLVIEVKGGKLLHHAGSGNWLADGKPATGNPVDQLQAQWGAVLRRLQRAAREAQSRLNLYVDKVLALPDVEIGEKDESHQGIEWDLIADRNDLQWFESWWRRRFLDQPVGDDARTLFMDTFGPTARPAEVRHFVHHSEEIFRRQCLANFEMLDMLEANRQLLVEGGAGTGKTWHAMVKAVRLARGGGGRRVLLLCYNLALAGEIRKVVDCNPPLGDGGIDVMAWEELARSLIEEAGLKWSPPPAEAPREHVARFYDMQVPELMAQAIDRLEAGAVLPRWDALVVDEAQDHDTGGTANWWAMYVRLLKQGSRSRVALFLDPAQRPEFRRGEFVTGDLIATLDHPVRVRLPKPLRYTGPIADYLKSLKGRGWIGWWPGLAAPTACRRDPRWSRSGSTAHRRRWNASDGSSKTGAATATAGHGTCCWCTGGARSRAHALRASLNWRAPGSCPTKRFRRPRPATRCCATCRPTGPRGSMRWRSWWWISSRLIPTATTTGTAPISWPAAGRGNCSRSCPTPRLLPEKAGASEARRPRAGGRFRISTSSTLRFRPTIGLA